MTNNHKYNLSLVRELAVTGFKLKFKNSVLGYLWSLMRPLFLFIILYFVFTVIFKLGNSIPNYPVYLLIGITLWGFFTEATSVVMSSIVSSGDLIRKIYFPRIVIPIAMSLTSLMTLVLNMVVVFGFAIYSHVSIGPMILTLPLYLIEYYIFTLGVSLFLAAVFVRFRDIGPIWEILCQALFYGTPILYSISLVNRVWLVQIMMLNPLAQIIQDVRQSFLGSDVVTSSTTLGVYSFLPFLFVVVTFLVGYFVFRNMAAKFAEEV
jgi:ABC-2 type transport system permease protein